MYQNRFSVRVIGGQERDDGYVAMAHGKDYRLALRNDREDPCDATVKIDGKDVGVWRIESHGTITLERPANDRGKFTFYKVGTPDGDAAGLVKGDPNLGLISVTFTPGRRPAARPLVVSQPWSVTTTWPTWHPTHPNYREQYRWLLCGNTNATYTTTTDTSYATTNAPCGSTVTANYSNTNARTLQDSIPLAASAGFDAGGTGLSGHSGQEFGVADYIEHDFTQQVTINLRLVGAKEAAAVRPLKAVSTPVPPPIE